MPLQGETRTDNEGTEHAVFATPRYPQGVLVNLHASWLNAQKTRDITVVGENRMLTFDDMNISEPLCIYDEQAGDAPDRRTYVDSFSLFRASIPKGRISVPQVLHGEPLATQCAHFVECITKGKPPLTGGNEGITVVRTLEAMQRSIRAEGREEQVKLC